MSQVFIGYDNYGIEGVDDEYIYFIFNTVLSSLKQDMDKEVGLVIVNEEKIQKFNHKYRGKDKPTNVLSFTNKEIPDLPNEPEFQDNNYLGDIYICYQIMLSEAKELEVAPCEHFARLFIHGLLHLTGFDHENSFGATKMEEMENKVCELIR